MRLLYLGQAPAQGTGSPVTLLRHLRRFAADGWQIGLVPNWGDELAEARRHGWTAHRLPHRRWWWPPFNAENELSRRLTTTLWAREVDRLIQPRPDAVLTYLAWHSDLFAEIASAYGRRTGVPVSCLVHDDAVDFATNAGRRAQLRRRQTRILRGNHRNWFVSAAQAAAMAPTGAHADVLPPIPEGFAGPAPQWHSEFGARPRVCFAGYLWPEQGRLLQRLAPVLAAAGARLVVLGRRTAEVEALLAADLADHVPPFPGNHEALAYLSANVAGLVVSYAATIGELPWSRTSMPSKLVEFSHLGLPIALVAPPGTAIADWARQRGIGSCFAPADHAGLSAWAAALRHRESWLHQSDTWRNLAATEWSPAVIHSRLAHSLRSGPPAPAPIRLAPPSR